jgi:hypothetical protein
MFFYHAVEEGQHRQASGLLRLTARHIVCGVNERRIWAFMQMFKFVCSIVLRQLRTYRPEKVRLTFRLGSGAFAVDSWEWYT